MQSSRSCLLFNSNTESSQKWPRSKEARNHKLQAHCTYIKKPLKKQLAKADSNCLMCLSIVKISFGGLGYLLSHFLAYLLTACSLTYVLINTLTYWLRGRTAFVVSCSKWNPTSGRLLGINFHFQQAARSGFSLLAGC